MDSPGFEDAETPAPAIGIVAAIVQVIRTEVARVSALVRELRKFICGCLYIECHRSGTCIGTQERVP